MSDFNLTIIHVEDEYHAFQDLPVVFRAAIENYFYEIDQDIFAKYSVISEEQEKPSSWKVCAIEHDDKTPKFKIGYIFLKDSKHIENIFDFISENRVFILDVLRPSPDGTILEVTVQDSLRNISQFRPNIEDIVLFSAYQGQEELEKKTKDIIEEKYNGVSPKIISKSDIDGLINFVFSSIIKHIGNI